LRCARPTADYDSALSTEDNTERRYYLGYTWDATAATTGVVKIGRMTKDFDAAGRAGYSGSSWEAAPALDATQLQCV
jgi:hypothetical protein